MGYFTYPGPGLHQVEKEKAFTFSVFTEVVKDIAR